MRYLIDGYNFLFRLRETRKQPLEKRRESLIEILDQELSCFKTRILLVFDSSEQICDYAQCAPKKNLDILYAPRGKTADCYIIELVDSDKNPGMVTVVSSDSGLTRQCQHLGAHTLTIEKFLTLVFKKRHKTDRSKKPDYRQSSAEMERLRKIFEERFNQ